MTTDKSVCLDLLTKPPKKLNTYELSQLEQVTLEVVKVANGDTVTVELLYMYHDRLVDFQGFFSRESQSFAKIGEMEDLVWTKMMELIQQSRSELWNHNVEKVCAWYTQDMGEQ